MTQFFILFGNAYSPTSYLFHSLFCHVCHDIDRKHSYMAKAASNDRAACFECKKNKIVYPCGGCSKQFCLKDLNDHRQNMSKQLDELENERDQFQQTLGQKKTNQQGCYWRRILINGKKTQSRKLSKQQMNVDKHWFTIITYIIWK